MPQKTLSDEDILTKVQAKVRNCVSWFDSNLSKEREKVIKYYEGVEPRRQSNGNSSYVSQDVYQAVEMLKAQLLDTFTSGNDILRFTPRNQNDVLPARVATEYCTHVIFEENEGFDVFDDTIHDGLTARNAVVDVYWDENYSYDEEHFEGLPIHDVMALAAQDDVSEIDAELDEDDYNVTGQPAYSGSYRRKIDNCKVVVEVVPPEEFFVQANVKRKEDGSRGRRVLKTKAELYELGLAKDKVDSINFDDERSLEFSPEVLARNNMTNATSTLGLGDDAVQDELQRVMLYETFTKLKIEDKVRLYKFTHAGDVLFDYEEVDEDSYIVFKPLRVAHTFWGDNFAARQFGTQNASTVLMRGILDHTAITNVPRWQVVQGALLNPKEMLDNRMGGLVNVTRPDGIAPLQQANLNPFVFETLGMLKDRKEETTGISSLSQGLNKDAISTQNSGALVDNLVTLSQVRQKIIAKRFAKQFLVPLYLKVYKLAMQYEKKQKVLEVAGVYVTVSPQEWKDRTRMSVSLNLGYGEQDKEAAKYTAMYDKFTSTPAMSKWLPPDKEYKLLTDAMQKNKVYNYADYVVTPDKLPPPPKPDPIELTKAQAMLKQADAAFITAQSHSDKAQVSMHHEAIRTDLDERKFEQQAVSDERTQARQDLDTANRINVSQRELKMAEKAPKTAIIAPH